MINGMTDEEWDKLAVEVKASPYALDGLARAPFVPGLFQLALSKRDTGLLDVVLSDRVFREATLKSLPRPPIFYAIETGWHPGFVSLLKNKSLDPLALDPKGRTAMFPLVLGSNGKTVRLLMAHQLLDAGLDLSTTDLDGKTCFEVGGDPEFCSTLSDLALRRSTAVSFQNVRQSPRL